METMIINQFNKTLPDHEKLINGIYGLRHDIFKTRLNWDVKSTSGQEKDRFDELDSYHIAMTNKKYEIEGCWRALPTTGDYMLESVFPELLQGETPPKSGNVWEISRFAVRKGQTRETQGYINNITINLVESFWNFAKTHDIKSYVTVTSVACERILRLLNVNMRRMGEGKEVQIGKERSVALWIEVNNDYRAPIH